MEATGVGWIDVGAYVLSTAVYPDHEGEFPDADKAVEKSNCSPL